MSLFQEASLESSQPQVVSSPFKTPMGSATQGLAGRPEMIMNRHIYLSPAVHLHHVSAISSCLVNQLSSRILQTTFKSTNLHEPQWQQRQRGHLCDFVPGQQVLNRFKEFGAIILIHSRKNGSACSWHKKHGKTAELKRQRLSSISFQLRAALHLNMFNDNWDYLCWIFFLDPTIPPLHIRSHALPCQPWRMCQSAQATCWKTDFLWNRCHLEIQWQNGTSNS